MTIPNFITLARFLTVPVIVYAMINGAVLVAFVLFLLAGLSDGIDGFIARHFNQRSTLGTYLDPIADKVLLVSVFIVLGVMGQLPQWLVGLVVTRDALIVVAIIVSSLMSHPVAMRPILLSKANTAVQIALAMVVMGQLAFEAPLPTLTFLLVWAVAALTVLSGGAYLIGWLRHMAGYDD